MPPALLLLGVDFGTSFTKVVWRDWGGVRVGAAPVGDNGEAIAPSVVWIDRKGGLQMQAKRGAAPERLLKMRLADVDPTDRPADELAALCVFFVGSILRRAIASARRSFPGRDVSIYEAALGFPAAHCDDEHLAAFQRVAAAAWRWAHSPDAPDTLGPLIAWMRVGPADPLEGLFEVRPEVAAAVDCFTMRLDTEPGRYVFLDVGGGTLDGACFIIYRHRQKTMVTVLATKVDRLGVEMLAEEAAAGDTRKMAGLRDQLFRMRASADPKWDWARKRVSGFIGGLMMAAKKDDDRSDWLAARDSRNRAWISLEGQIDLARRLPVFYGGGGMACQLYREAAESVGYDLSKNYGVPRFALGGVAAPDGFEGDTEIPFHRFAVAYGLTRPFTEAPAWKLPDRSSAAAPRPVREVADRFGVDYLSNRDAYD